jgi:hypothetical protein
VVLKLEYSATIWKDRCGVRPVYDRRIWFRDDAFPNDDRVDASALRSEQIKVVTRESCEMAGLDVIVLGGRQQTNEIRRKNVASWPQSAATCFW